MKFIWLLLLLILLSFKATTAYAQSVTVTPTPLVEQLENNPSTSSNILNSFFSSFDWLSGGLIFSTPNVMENNIKLADGTELSGISQYRNIFYDIAIPIFVIITSFTALSHITNDNSYQLKNFFKRLVVVVILFTLTPYILVYSTQFINLLNNKINTQNSLNLVSFITDYVKSEDFQKQFGTSPNLLKFLSLDSLMQTLVTIVSIGFLLIGFLYIIFQSIFRFIALLFLSVLFPIVLPFALSERTENIANTYFRTWFTFLIQQPAFVLGFAIVSTIFGSILKAHGGNIGTLFLYSGSLIFLGGINVFVGRIFGDGWSMLSTNARSMVASGAITGLGTKTFREVKRGAITGNVSGVRSYAGAYLGNRIRQKLHASDSEEESNGDKKPSYQAKMLRVRLLNDANTAQHLPVFSREAKENGLKTEVINKKQGIVKIKGDGYSYSDPRSGLAITYLSKTDAIASGRRESELKPVKIDHNIMDHSYFNKENPSSYHEYALSKAKKDGLRINSYLAHASNPQPIKEFLDLTQADFEQKQVKGMLMKQYDTTKSNQAKFRTLRIYSNKPL